MTLVVTLTLMLVMDLVMIMILVLVVPLIHRIVSRQEKDNLGIRTSHRHKVDASDIIRESGDKLSDDIFKLLVIKVSLDKGETSLTKLGLFEIG